MSDPSNPTIDDDTGRISVLDLCAELIVYRRTVFASVVVGVVLSLSIALTRTAKYEAATTVMAAVAGGAESRLAGLASQFGLGNLADSRGGQAASPDLIVQLARSNDLLERILDDTVGATSPEGPRVLLDVILPMKPGAAAPTGTAVTLRRARAIDELRDIVVVVKNKSTGSATISAATESPLVSFDITQAVVRELNVTFQMMGRGQAREERRFVAERLRESEEDLRTAERDLSTFLSSNRDFKNSPSLTFEHDRLQRVVSRQQQVVVTLSESAEDAAIRSVRDTPALLVVEPASVPVLPQPRRRALILALGVLGGGVLGTFLVLAGASIRELERRGRADWRDFRIALTGALGRPARESQNPQGSLSASNRRSG